MILSGHGPGSSRPSMVSMRRSRSCGWRCSPCRARRRRRVGCGGACSRWSARPPTGSGSSPACSSTAPSRRWTPTSPITSCRSCAKRCPTSPTTPTPATSGSAVSVADDVILTVSDDGIGVPAEVLGGRGLTNMAARARDLGGDFTISPQPRAVPSSPGRCHSGHQSRHDTKRQRRTSFTARKAPYRRRRLSRDCRRRRVSCSTGARRGRTDSGPPRCRAMVVSLTRSS